MDMDIEEKFLNREYKLRDDFVACAKWLHVLMNIALLGIGVAVLYVTSLAYLDRGDDLLLIYNYASINVIVMTTYAAILVLASILGLISFIRMSFFGLLTATIIQFLLVVAAINYTIWRGLTEDYTVQGDAYKQLSHEIKNYQKHDQIIDILQQRFSCCGAKDYTEWGAGIPDTCCPPGNTCTADHPLLYKRGCFHDLATLIAHYNWMILIGLGFLIAIQVFSIFVTGMLCKFIAFAKETIKDIEASMRIPRVPTETGAGESKSEPQTVEERTPPEAPEPPAEPAEAKNEEPTQEVAATNERPAENDEAK